MKRGDIVIVSLPGNYGKPKPAVVIQNDRFEGRLETYIIALLTIFDEGAKVIRVNATPTAKNGLRKESKIMVDKLYAIPEHRIHQRVGKFEGTIMRRIDRALMMMLDLDPLGQARALD